MDGSAPLSGRRAEAARNDRRILEAARAVFVNNPASPISEVAQRARVGISAVYRRFDSKEELLRRLCSDGLDLFIEAAEAGLADDRNAWTVFSEFMRQLVDADMHSLTLRLAGTFPSTEELYAKASRGHEILVELFERIRASGAIRADLEVDDIPMLLEQVAAIRLGDESRTHALRHRYLTLILDGLRPGSITLLVPPPRTARRPPAGWVGPARARRWPPVRAGPARWRPLALHSPRPRTGATVARVALARPAARAAPALAGA
jgi:AcrR family transcriptional regulator